MPHQNTPSWLNTFEKSQMEAEVFDPVSTQKQVIKFLIRKMPSLQGEEYFYFLRLQVNVEIDLSKQTY